VVCLVKISHKLPEKRGVSVKNTTQDVNFWQPIQACHTAQTFPYSHIGDTVDSVKLFFEHDLIFSPKHQ